MSATAKKYDPIEVAIMFVRSNGPVTKEQIACELLDQCSFTKTKEDAIRQAGKAIKHGLDRGYLERYDDVS